MRVAAALVGLHRQRAALQSGTRLETIADVVDLKLPWMTGFTRQVGDASLACAAQLGLTAAAGQRVSLSAREIEVLRRISRGESNKEVARALSLNPSTVRTHVENAFRKLGCSTRAAATLKAATLGLL